MSVHTKHERDLSIIIPLKGWDESLPMLINSLLNQDYKKQIEILLIVDPDNPHLSNIPTDEKIQFLHTKPKPMGWMDKNWRLRQGVKHALFHDFLFLDSDVKVDPNFLSLRSSFHQRDLSYCLPIYREAYTSAEKFLSAFTNYNNFYFYKTSTALMSIGTAVGPSVLVTVGKEILTKALEETYFEVADDHALGHWFKKNKFKIACHPEPVYVAKSNAG